MSVLETLPLLCPPSLGWDSWRRSALCDCLQGRQRHCGRPTAPLALRLLYAGVALSSERKWGAVCFGERGTLYLGAPDFLLPDASHPLHRTVQYHTRNGCRVLLLSHSQAPLDPHRLPEDLAPVAAVVLCDTLRPEAKDTLSFCQRGRTGQDHLRRPPMTVASIARRWGCPARTAISTFPFSLKRNWPRPPRPIPFLAG
ncbi:MAG: hypothetical protein ACLUVV_01440 [Christensenellales bacterium]